MTQQDVLDILGMHPAGWLTTSDLARIMRVAPSCAWGCCKRLHEAGFVLTTAGLLLFGLTVPVLAPPPAVPQRVQVA